MPDLFGSDLSVQPSSELFRIRDLPRRTWTHERAAELAEELTDLLKTPSGEMKLFPIQAIALYEMGTEDGMFGPMKVGAGKTLVSLLAPTVTFSERPLLLVPAKLLKKTDRERAKLEQHWELKPLRMMSYELLGRTQSAEALERYQPDLIIADEAHHLKNRRAAVTRRVMRYFLQKPETKFVPMSGTITRRSLFDYWHLLRRTLPPKKVPLPGRFEEVEMWAAALDENKDSWQEADPAALKIFCNEEELGVWKQDPRKAARQAFRRRLIETSGVVATAESPIDASLSLTAVEVPVSKEVDDAFEQLRKSWETPDGWPISDGLGMFRHARELALGFFYLWNPRPPDPWLEARRAWASYVRQVLKHSRKWDSELQVRNALGDETKEWQKWAEIKESFVPNTEAVWLDDSVLEFCASWADKHRGIIWVEHAEFGRRLEREFKLPYYGKKGLDGKGRMIEDHDPKTSMVASVASNGEGRNLQAWCENLIVSMPPSGSTLEQLIGRTHRHGQEADEVSFEMVVTCSEHLGALEQALRDCQYVSDTTGSPQKLLLADITVPSASTVAGRASARWR